MLTDFYGQQSCTAGARPSSPAAAIRTGLTKVGMPGATARVSSAEDPTFAQFLKNFGYATGSSAEPCG